MAELVDALDLGSSVFGREGSSPFIRIASDSIRDEAFIVLSGSVLAKSYSKLAHK